VDKAWLDFKESYAGLSDSQILEPGVQGRWSVRDILAHVTTWEEEALTISRSSWREARRRDIPRRTAASMPSMH
jgi:hypothetical protein